MELAQYRSRAPRLRRCPGLGVVELRPLSRAAIEVATWLVDERWRAEGGGRTGRLYLWAVKVALLELALGAAPLSVPLRTLDALWDLWLEVQREHHPPPTFAAEAELQIAEADLATRAAELAEASGYPAPRAPDASLAWDAMACAVAKSVGDFFGEPVCELSDGQLSYFLTLRAAHNRAHDPEQSDRCVSLEELRRKASR